ncbi:MAG: flagellar biosynthesis regulator FlhF [Bacteroidetes bacterium]|nr:flagellar biosynthesis regulator FlhF [Bacteroidota bacterium]
MSIQEIKISQWEKFSHNIGSISIVDYLEQIRSGVYQKHIEALREMLHQGNKEGADILKKNLPGVTFSAQFSEKRLLKNIVFYNHILVFDIDKLDNENSAILLRNTLSKDKYVLSAFVSPSGVGVKFLVRINEDTPLTSHKDEFSRIAQRYEEKYNIIIDRSGADIGRLCFASYDPDLYFNAYSEFIPIVDKKNIETIYRNVLRTVKNEDGSRNNCLFRFAKNALRNDFSKEEIFSFAKTKFTLSDTEIFDCIKNVENDTPTNKKTSFRKGSNMFETLKLAEDLINKRYRLIFNEILENIEYIDLQDKDKAQKYKIMNSNYPSEISRYLRHNRCDFSTAQVVDLLKSDFVKKFNPFKQFLQDLPEWNETMEDYILELSKTLEVKDSQRWYNDLKCFMIGIVASILKKYRKNEINHSMLVFIAKEGIGKTTWFNNLLPPELHGYFYTGLPRFDDKDTLKLLHETLLCNIDEINTLGNRDFNYLNELITKPQIRMRKVFGHFAENFQHHASFCGTLNDEIFLPSNRGQRRYAIHTPISINYQHTVDMRMVYAQALFLYNKGERYWLNQEEIDQRKDVNTEHVGVSPEEELFMQYVVKPSSDEKDWIINPPIWKTSSEIVAYISNFAKLQISSASIRTVGILLRQESFVSKKVKGNNLWFVNLRTEKEIKEINIYKYKTDNDSSGDLDEK